MRKFVIAGLAAAAGIAAACVRPPFERGLAPQLDSIAVPSPAARPAVRAEPPRRVVVYVAGEVRRPGVYTLDDGARAVDALARAGGPQADADLVAVDLAERLEDGAEVAIPKIGATATRRSSAENRGARTPRHRRGRRRHRSAPTQRPNDGGSEQAAKPLDLNAATAADLATLPGLGEALAARIVAYRDANGPFGSVDELADVAGITPRLQARLAASVVVR